MKIDTLHQEAGNHKAPYLKIYTLATPVVSALTLIRRPN
jgi:hypothetical protein